jgi:transcriptional regulator GlxA family with amidase domain
VRDAKRIIKKRHVEFDLSLTDVAEAVGSSPRQIQRAFREEADTEYRAVLLGVRVEAARRLLGQSKTVKAAARAVGYRSASGLTAAFRRIGERPPSAFQPEPPEYLGDADEATLASSIGYR